MAACAISGGVPLPSYAPSPRFAVELKTSRAQGVEALSLTASKSRFRQRNHVGIPHDPRAIDRPHQIIEDASA